MKVKPTQNGGRIAEGDTPWLRYRIVDGEVDVWEPKTPERDDAIDRAKPERLTNSPASWEPGDVLAWIIEQRVGRKLNCAECGEWRKWMNQEGWVKCLTVHRRTILDRIESEAERHGVDYDGIVAELWKWARGQGVDVQDDQGNDG